MTTAFYSHIFSCLYDEPAPIGRLGRSAHHSVFRSVQWRDIGGAPLKKGRIHDFAIIWDEDHDTRVIRVAERLHLGGFLWPVVFIGERKGVLTILFAAMAGPLQDRDNDHLAQIQAIAEDAGDDSWTCHTGWFRRVEALDEGTPYTGEGIINDEDWRVVNYLNGIDALWELGEKGGAAA
ncbi:hypothetical protein [Azospirillum argentinense]|uniref:Uncharacterized protein n=1 Tax=Azospirillum brasilense TaxID=192 RepID=A0A4D8PZB8_AZOBR|nr:hypothetical protein [Azospirillum argentinense]QCO03095.1 hypothetical protein D3867_14385 [Azospirillum argentinense]